MPLHRNRSDRSAINPLDGLSVFGVGSQRRWRWLRVGFIHVTPTVVSPIGRTGPIASAGRVRETEMMPGKTTLMSAALLLSTQVSGGAQTATHSKARSQPSARQSAKQKIASPLDGAVRALFAVHRFEQTAISPDGQNVAWVETLIGHDGSPDGKSAIYVAAVNGAGVPRHISARLQGTAHAEGNVAWSPDGKQIAFLSDTVKAGQPQLYVGAAAGGPARMLTRVKGFLAAPSWSTDGKTIALLFTENATRAAGPLVAETPQTGEIKEAVTEQRLTVVDVASGKLHQLSPADMYVYEYDWSPDGKRFVATAAHGNGDNNWYVAELYTLDAAGGEMKSIYKPPLQIANPAWSPDGQAIAFIAGLMSDEPAVGGDIFTVNDAGGAPRNLTPGMKASASWLTWTAERGILFGEYVEGDAGIATVDPGTGRIELLFRGAGQL